MITSIKRKNKFYEEPRLLIEVHSTECEVPLFYSLSSFLYYYYINFVHYFAL